VVPAENACVAAQSASGKFGEHTLAYVPGLLWRDRSAIHDGCRLKLHLVLYLGFQDGCWPARFLPRYEGFACDLEAPEAFEGGCG
jgi:hypothetical protein